MWTFSFAFAVAIALRSCVIAAEAIVLLVTLKVVREAKHTNVQSSLLTILLRNGERDRIHTYIILILSFYFFGAGVVCFLYAS